MYNNNINPLKDVKQEQNPVNKMLFNDLPSLFAIMKPNKNEPNIEIIK